MGSTLLSIALYSLLASAVPLEQPEDGVSAVDRFGMRRPKLLGRPKSPGLRGLLRGKGGSSEKGSSRKAPSSGLGSLLSMRRCSGSGLQLLISDR
jgi:hypothetical protein